MLEVKNLGKADFVYLCNCTGEPNDPASNDPLFTPEPETVMHPMELELYNHFQKEDFPHRYVLRMGDGSAAMGLGVLCDTGWCEDLICNKTGTRSIAREKVEKTWMPRMLDAIHAFCNDPDFRKVVEGCDVYVGEMSDPDGHEILVAVPYAMQDHIEAISEWLNDEAYTRIEGNFERWLHEALDD